MRIVFFLILVFGTWTSAAQAPQLDYAEADKRARFLSKEKAKTTDTLAHALTLGFTNDFEKFRSLYTWVIYHLQFDEKAYRQGNRRLNHNIGDIMFRRKAVCFGYAQLIQHLCDKVNIPCYIVTGYAKQRLNSKPKLKASDHAWNAVQLEGNWYVLDASWASNTLGKTFELKERYQVDYYLTPPQYFILNHLPEQPMWQLLDGPIEKDDFLLPGEQLHQLVVGNEEKSFHYTDSIARWSEQEPAWRKITAAKKAYQFNPVEANANELAATYLDYETILSTRADSLTLAKDFTSLLQVQEQMIGLCEQAHEAGRVFENQSENCAYTRINYVLANLNSSNQKGMTEEMYRQMQQHLSKAKALLETLPSSMIRLQNLANIKEYQSHLKEEFGN